MQPEHQAAVQLLILAGLEEHWGWLDPLANPDLEDLHHSYAGDTFLLAWWADELLGCGALICEAAEVGRIVRMSVAQSARRLGIGTQILQALLEAARQRGYRQVVLETTSTWADAIQFYLHNGFQITKSEAQDTHFKLDL